MKLVFYPRALLLTMSLLGVLSTQVFSQAQPWEIKKVAVSAKDQQMKDDLEKLLIAWNKHFSGTVLMGDKEIALMDKLYAEDPEYSKTAVDVKAYAFKAISSVKEIDLWHKEIDELLVSKHKQLAGAAIDVIYFILKNGSERERILITNKQGLFEKLDDADKRFPTVNVSRKIKELTALAAPYKGMDLPIKK